MNHGDITKEVSKHTGVRPEIIEDVITVLFGAICESLAAGSSLTEKPQSAHVLPFTLTPRQAKSEA